MIFSLKYSLKIAMLASIGFFVLSCGSYQSSSYYGEDGIYGATNSQEKSQNPTQQTIPPSESSEKIANQNGKYYKDYFSKKAQEYDYINDENTDVFTDVDNYSSVDPNINGANQDEVYYNNSHGAWGSNPTKVNINFYNNPRPYFSYWGYSNPWYFNNFYYDPFYDPFFYDGYYGHFGWRWRYHYNPFNRFYHRNHWGYYGHGYSSYYNRSYHPYHSNVSYTRGYRGSVPSRRGTSAVSVVGQNRGSSISSRSYNPQSSTASQSVSSRAVSSDRRASYRNVENRSNNVSKNNSNTGQAQRVYQNRSQTNNTTNSNSNNNFRVQNYRRSNSNNTSTSKSSNNSSDNSYQSSSRSSNSYNSSSSRSSRSYSAPRSSSSSRSSSSRSSRR